VLPAFRAEKTKGETERDENLLQTQTQLVTPTVKIKTKLPISGLPNFQVASNAPDDLLSRRVLVVEDE
jgi:hypothetical protein